MKPYEVFKRKLIYVYAIPDDAHKGLLKIGETTIAVDRDPKNLPPNCKALNEAARARIKQYTNTAGIACCDPLHTELAITDDGKVFGDKDVHKVLIRSGVKKVSPEGTTAREWFRIDLPTAIRAIQAVKRGNKALKRLPKTFRDEIVFRPEQERAINRTVKYFAKKRNKIFLWNAKMRFGKTLCALEVVRRMKFAKTIIVTHRPAVKENWFDDYGKIFHDDNYGSKSRGENLKTLQARGKNFVYFASIQDLRGSERFDKNHDILGETWDFVIVDEAHEGTQTTIGKKLLAELVKPATKVLQLSGTPFNLVDDFTEENSFTWDYVNEQRAKANWHLNHGDDPNPYAELPKMHIYTYDLGELIGKSYLDIFDKAFNFREFFRTNDDENFVHEADVKRFLDLLVKADKNNYPFSRPEFCDTFRHTLWIVPGVKAGYALSQLLQSHRVFCNFGIANVAGDGDEDIPYTDALKLVQDTIRENDYSITISCGKLTAGVTVPEWTAVLYLAGSYSTSPTSYLQTIFRVQNPCNSNGVIKENCFVFDFAPDRTLKMVTEAADVSARAGQTSAEHRKRLGEFLNFCPVIALTGSKMHEFDADKLLQDIKSVYAERAVRNGFDDKNLYDDKLLKLTDVDWQKFVKLKGIIGTGTTTKPSEVTVNKQGLDDEQHEDTGTGKKPKRELSPEEKELQRQRQVKRNAISILRQVSIRMPLLIYGAEVDFDTDITIDKFADLVDDASWAEFMPKGVTKDFFAEFVDYYDPDVFIKAGHLVRERAKAADELTPTERVKEIAEMFATFKNPDKETVLTPWRVVNLHMTEVFGGWNFFADNPPQLVPTKLFRANAHILEINSKTGLYPLFVAYSIYRARLGNDNEADKSLDELRRVWDETVNDNVFVICKTPMAKTITRRTLTGYRGSTVNAECFKDLIPTLKMTPQRFINRVTEKNFWHKGAGTMFFDAVVGNPPYQNAAAGDSTRMMPVYNHFIDTAFQLADKVSLIHPARCLFTAGDTSNEFNQRLLSNPHVKVVRYEADSKALFPTSEIKGGVAITYYDAKQNFGAIGLFIPWDELRSVHQKVCVDNKDFRPLSELVYPRAIYRFASDNSFVDTNAFDKMSASFFDAAPHNGHKYVQVLGLKRLQRAYKWIRRDWITAHETLDKWKVFVPQANGSGEFGETLSAPLVGSPLVGNTATFTVIGAFDTCDEAEACLKYIKTKFCRALLGVLKVTQHNPPSTWAKVPLQDFTSSSDIDWTQTVAQIDEQLYRKYGLTQAEVDFIETHVKEMP